MGELALVEDAELVQRAAQLGSVTVNAKGTGARQLVLAVAAAQQANAEHAGAAGSEQVPDGIADHVAVGGRNAEPLGAGEKEIRLRFRPVDVAALDDHRLLADAERLERGVDLRPTSGRGYPVRDPFGSELGKQLDSPGKRPPLGQQLAVELAVAILDRVRLLP